MSICIDKISYPATVREENTVNMVKVIKCGDEKEFEIQVSNFLHKVMEADCRIVHISHSSHYNDAFGDRYIALIVYKE